MSARTKRARFAVFAGALVAVASAGMAARAEAQISASGPLGGVNPWGVGWISSSEHALPSDFWGDSRKSDLTPLFQSIDPDRLSPAELTLLTRVLMSSSKAPEGDSDEMILQRVRLLNAIGAEDKVLDLYRRFPNASWARPTAQIEVDQDLTAGDHSRACARVDGVTDVESFWMRARIACLVIAGDVDAAQLAAELAGSSGVDDPWLFSVVSGLSDETDARPPAHFETGVSTAISLEAGLIAPVNAFDTVSPYRAAIIAQRKDAPAAIRLMATQRAAVAGALTPKAERAALAPKPPAPAEPVEGETAPETSGLQAPATPLQQAVAAVADPDVALAQKAAALTQALKAANSDPRTFNLHSRALLPELSSIPQTLETIEHAPYFTRALIAADDMTRARKWRDAMDADLSPPPPEPDPVDAPAEGPLMLDPEMAAPEPEPIPAPEPVAPPAPAPTFSDQEKAELDAYLALAGDRTALNNLYVTAMTLSEATKKRDASRMLYLLSGMGADLPAEARRMLSQERRAHPAKPSPVSEAAMQMEIAADSGAVGEAMMHAVHVLRMDREGQRDAISVYRALKMLGRYDQRDAARAAALEAAGLWDVN